MLNDEKSDVDRRLQDLTTLTQIIRATNPSLTDYRSQFIAEVVQRWLLQGAWPLP